jgi:hypothetical protein
MNPHDDSTHGVVARAPTRLSAPQRLALTAMLAIGLLGIGGVALAQAADPTSSPTTTTTQTTNQSDSNSGGSTTKSGHHCPNMNGSSSSTSSSTSS